MKKAFSMDHIRCVTDKVNVVSVAMQILPNFYEKIIKMIFCPKEAPCCRPPGFSEHGLLSRVVFFQIAICVKAHSVLVHVPYKNITD